MACLEVGVHGIHPELQNLLGRLHYRTSYGQNILRHSIEVAHLGRHDGRPRSAWTRRWPSAAGCCTTSARRSTTTTRARHPAARHGGRRALRRAASRCSRRSATTTTTTPAAACGRCWSRPPTRSRARARGARRESLEIYIKRLESLEKIANAFPGVEKSYAIQAGREIRIMVEHSQRRRRARPGPGGRDRAPHREGARVSRTDPRHRDPRDARGGLRASSHRPRRSAGPAMLNILFIADVIGSPGRDVVQRAAARRSRSRHDARPRDLQRRELGWRLRPHARRRPPSCSTPASTCLTGGNHLWDRKEPIALPGARSRASCASPICRRGTPGRAGASFRPRDGTPVGVVNLIGRVFMKEADCPFRAADRGARGAARRRCRGDLRRLPRRDHRREDGDRLAPRRPRQRGWSERTRTSRPPTSACCRSGTAFLMRRRHDGRFRVGDRHGPRGRVAPLSSRCMPERLDARERRPRA